MGAGDMRSFLWEAGPGRKGWAAVENTEVTGEEGREGIWVQNALRL